MTLTSFLTLLMSFSTITSLITEGLKKFLDSMKINYACNILVLIVAIVVGCAGTFVYYQLAVIPINTMNVIFAILMGIANWFGAMVGYDKVKQAIEQLAKK